MTGIDDASGTPSNTARVAIEAQLEHRANATKMLDAYRKEVLADVAPDAGQLLLATEFRVPCPDPADPGRPDGAPVLRPEPLIIQKIAGYWATKFPDGWMILNPNLEPGGQVWTGERWEYNGQVFAGVKYQWTRDQAIALGRELVAEETWRFEMWLARMRAGREA